MKELSLYVLDLFQNSLSANSSTIKLFFKRKKNLLTIKITDNGTGMDQEMLAIVTDPFATTRKNRNVGLGLAFFSQMIDQTKGDFSIHSKKDVGTCIKAVVNMNHLDTPPIGDLAETVAVILMSLSNSHQLIFVCENEQDRFEMDTADLREILGEDIRFEEPAVLGWIKSNIKQAVRLLLGGNNEKNDRRTATDQAENA